MSMDSLPEAVDSLFSGRWWATMRFSPGGFSRGREYVSYDKMRVADGGRKHGICPADAIAAATNYVASRRASRPGAEPYRELRAGWDTRGRLLEVVVLTTSAGEDVVIHAMPCRPAIRRRLGL